MIQVIKEAGTILRDLPDLAIWILLGILFYKVAILGSIFGIVKLFINKAHSVLTKPKEKIIKYDFDDFIYKHDGALNEFKEFFKDFYYFKGSFHLDKKDVRFIIHCYKQKLKDEGIKNYYQMSSYMDKLKDGE